MVRYELDAVDAGVWVTYILSLFILVESATFSMFGIAASDELFTLASGSVVLSIAGVVAVGSYAMTYLTQEDAEIPSMEDEYGYLVAGSAAVTAALVFSADFQDWVVAQHDIVSLGVVAVSAAGLGVVGYLK